MTIEQMSRIELIGFITATAHAVAANLKANYHIKGNMKRGFIIVEMSTFKRRETFTVDLNNEDLPQHIANVAAKIQCFV